MFAQWVTNGVGIGVSIIFAVFTVLVFAAVIAGLMGILGLLFGEADRENEKRMRD